MAGVVVGWVYLGFVTAYVPYAAFRASKKFKALKNAPDKSALFLSTVFTQVFFGNLAFAVARFEGIALFPAPHPGWESLWYSLAFLVPTLGTIPVRWNWRLQDEKRRTMRRMPASAREVPLWALVSLGAGVTEEMTYRGALMRLWLVVLGSWWPAAIVCSVAFCLAHAVQGWRSMAVIFPMALANHLIVLATGDLYTMMAIHFVYDLLAGLYFLRLARKEGVTALGGPEPQSAS